MACASLCSPDFNNLCRLCAAKTSVLLGLHIFDSESDTRQIFKKICECLPIQVTNSDRLPKMVCEECVYKLDLLFEFREKSLKTERYLESILKSRECVEVKNSVSADNTEQTDHVMHNNCTVAENVTDDVTLQGNINVTSQVVLQSNSLHESVKSSTLCDPLLAVVTKPLREELHSTVSNTLNSNLIQSADVSEPIQESLCENITKEHREDTPHSASGIKCEPDVFIKDEGWSSDSSGSDSDKEESSVSVRVPNPIASEENDENSAEATPFVDVQNDEDSNEALGLPEEGSTNFLNPAANSLLMLSCPQSSDSQEKSSWLICNICGVTYSKDEDFQAHYETHCLKCGVCRALFTTEEALLSHCSEIHPISKDVKSSGETSYSTSTTDIAFDNASTSDSKSISRRKKWEPKVCKECGKQYRTNYKLAEHMRKHTGEKPFQCSVCPKAFRSKIGLAQHEARHTGQFDYNCNTCGKGFQCKSYLIVHQRVHSDVKPFPCTTCGRNFKTKQALLDHNNRHLGVKPYLCETCGRRFITKGLCKSHQKVHSGTDNKQYPCSVCNKLFVSKSYLTTHLRIHTGEKPFMCEVCGKGFLTRVDLRIHSTMHTGEKSFVCEWCGKAFARRDALRCHRRSHTGERPYSCDVCGQSFTQFSPLTIHKRLHTGERPYVCDVCSKTFVSRSTMMAHRKKHTT